jgi:hypothetical protein
VFQKPVLDWELKEEVQGLLDVYYLESVRAGDVYGCVGEVDCGECAAELVDL